MTRGRRSVLLFAVGATIAGAGACNAAGDLDAVSPYPVQPGLAGTIRMGGSDLNGLVLLWERAFSRRQPGVAFVNRMLSGDAAVGDLTSGAADMVANGREPVLTEFLAFAEVFHNDGPLQVAVATGSADKLGRTWAPVIYVNAQNPLRGLTMRELDGIFGAERTGGYLGYRWTTTLARPAAANIRLWGELGLDRDWRERPIQTYGYAPTGMSNFFELAVFHGGATWASGYRQYVEATAKQITEPAGGTERMMSDLEADPGGVAWAGLAHSHGHPGVRVVPIAASAGGPFIVATPQTVRSHVYPLARFVYMQMNKTPGEPLAPPVKAFVAFILSRDGQALTEAQGEYLSLTPALAETERRKLD